MEEGTIAGDSLQLGEDASEVWGAVTLVSNHVDGTKVRSPRQSYPHDDNTVDSSEVIVGDTLRRAWIRQKTEDADTLHLAGETLSRRGETLTAIRRVTLVQADLWGQRGRFVGLGRCGRDDSGLGRPELWSA